MKMKHLGLLSFGFTVLALSDLSRARHATYENLYQLISRSSVPIVNHDYVVKVREPLSSESLTNARQAKLDIRALDESSGIYRIRTSKMHSLASGLESISNLIENPEWIEPNFVVSIGTASRPNDQYWLDQWSFKNYGQESRFGAEGTVGADIRATDAWSLQKGSSSVIVAVIDTGIDYNHPDLKDNIFTNTAEKNGVPGVDDDGNGFTDDVYGWNFIQNDEDEQSSGKPGKPDPMDDQGHGTHVSGTIGALPDNNIGVAGINWDVSLMALKFLDKSGSGATIDGYQAIRYAADNNVDVINASWGGGGYSRLLEEGIKYALQKGVLFVAAAGNSATDNDEEAHYPSNYAVDNILSVAATDNHDLITSFSCFGFKTVHLAAPGLDIISTLPGNRYQSYSGTSMATPHVAGAAALLIAHDASLRKNPVAIKERLLATADRSPALLAKVSSGGRLNVLRALNNEVNSLPQQVWQEENYSLSITYPQKRVDSIWKIHKPGATALRVHFKWAHIDRPFDKAYLYDNAFFPVSIVPDVGHSRWSPMIEGDTAYVSFSNAIVRIEDWQGNVTKDPYPNNTSQGFAIDKIAFVMAAPLDSKEME